MCDRTGRRRGCRRRSHGHRARLPYGRGVVLPGRVRCIQSAVERLVIEIDVRMACTGLDFDELTLEEPTDSPVSPPRRRRMMASLPSWSGSSGSAPQPSDLDRCAIHRQALRLPACADSCAPCDRRAPRRCCSPALLCHALTTPIVSMLMPDAISLYEQTGEVGLGLSDEPAQVAADARRAEQNRTFLRERPRAPSAIAAP